MHVGVDVGVGVERDHDARVAQELGAHFRVYALRQE